MLLYGKLLILGALTVFTLLSRSETECTIALWIRALIATLIALLRIKQEAFEKCWAHLPLQAAARHCRTLSVHRCPRQRQRVTEGTAMAPWNGPKDGENRSSSF